MAAEFREVPSITTHLQSCWVPTNSLSVPLYPGNAKSLLHQPCFGVLEQGGGRGGEVVPQPCILRCACQQPWTNVQPDSCLAGVFPGLTTWPFTWRDTSEWFKRWILQAKRRQGWRALSRGMRVPAKACHFAPYPVASRTSLPWRSFEG